MSVGLVEHVLARHDPVDLSAAFRFGAREARTMNDPQPIVADEEPF